MVGQHLADPADQPPWSRCRPPESNVTNVRTSSRVSRRVVAGLVDELDVEQLGHQVVGRMVGAPVDVLREHCRRRIATRRLEWPGWPGTLRVLSLTRSRTVSWSLSGMPSSMPMTRIGICAPKSRDEVEPVARPRADRGTRAQNARICGSSAAIFRGVNTARQQPAVDRVQRRIFEDEDPRRHVDARPDEVEDVDLAVDEGACCRPAHARRRRSG